jgi:hypothetical protein
MSEKRRLPEYLLLQYTKSASAFAAPCDTPTKRRLVGGATESADFFSNSFDFSLAHLIYIK